MNSSGPPNDRRMDVAATGYYVLVRFERDRTGYHLIDSIHLPPHFDGPCWVKALVGITDHEVWVDISKAYLIEEHHAR